MRVLAVIDALNFGGAENLLSTLGQVGPAHDLEMSVVSLAGSTGARAAWLDVLEQAGLAVEFLGMERLAQPDVFPRLVRAIHRAAPDVVHAHLEESATLAPLATRISGHACVSTYHHVPRPLEGREKLREQLSVRAANRGEQVLFVSAASRDGFAAAYGGLRPHWSVVHNGIDLRRFVPAPPGSRAAVAAELRVPADAPLVTVLGRLGVGKGQAHAVTAWPAVLARVPDARLLLVGDGPLEDDLRRQVAAAGLEDRVVFAGRRTDVERVLAASTLALLPTVREALPTALIEAAACAVPAVATEGSGVAEVVDDGRTGLLVPYADPDRLADAVVAMLTDDERRASMGRAARRLAEQRFDAEVWADRLHDLYRRARRTASTRRGFRRRTARDPRPAGARP